MNKKYLIVYYIKMSKLFGKLQAGGNSRLFGKIQPGGNRLFGKVISQLFHNLRLLYSVSNGLYQAWNYGDKGVKIDADLAFGLGHPEVGVVLHTYLSTLLYKIHIKETLINSLFFLKLHYISSIYYSKIN